MTTGTIGVLTGQTIFTGKWSGTDAVPAIGDRVEVTLNGLGRGLVVGYWSDDDGVGNRWGGVEVRLDNAPEWHKKNRPDGIARVFGGEIAAIGAAKAINKVVQDHAITCGAKFVKIDKDHGEGFEVVLVAGTTFNRPNARTEVKKAEADDTTDWNNCFRAYHSSPGCATIQIRSLGGTCDNGRGVEKVAISTIAFIGKDDLATLIRALEHLHAKL